LTVRELPAELHAALLEFARLPRPLIASDFDGTLAPIVNRPADARPLPAAAAALKELAALPDTIVALVSGRSVTDLSALSGAPAGVHLIGSHGAESSAGFTQPIDTELLSTITSALHDIAAAHPGVTVETKPASVALHVRNAAPADADAALAAAHEAARSWQAELTEGKAVAEFAVVKTDKGEALDLLRDAEKASGIVYFGDDVTDEKDFRRLRDGDIGVKVGSGDTLAAYRVDSPDDVATALQLVLDTRRFR